MDVTIPQLPYHIIEHILDLADLPLMVRCEFIGQFRLTPRALPFEFEIERDLYYNFESHMRNYNKYIEKKQKNKKNYGQVSLMHTLINVPALDCEITVKDIEGDIIFIFERVIINYETGDCEVLRSTVCDALTGELIPNLF